MSTEPVLSLPGADPPVSLCQRLRAALPVALKARDRVAVAALRSALTAIDNAEAVEVGSVAGSLAIEQTPVGVGAADVERRSLTDAQVAQIVRAEVAEREAAAREYDRTGRPDRAQRLRGEAGVLSAHVGEPRAAMSQATLQTRRLELVPLSDEHLEHEIELDSDPEVMRYLGNGRARTREEVEVTHRRRLAAASRISGLGFWAGFVDGEFVGWWLLQPPERADQGSVEGQAELGYRLLRRHWRKGLASEGARELIRHGFSDLGLTRIFAETMAVNAASRATVAAVGMQHVRTFHLEWEGPLPGSEFGEVEYAISRQQWLARVTDETDSSVIQRY